jgi:hypothetical protein
MSPEVFNTFVSVLTEWTEECTKLHFTNADEYEKAIRETLDAKLKEHDIMIC